MGLGTVDYFEPRPHRPQPGPGPEERRSSAMGHAPVAERYASALDALGKRHGFKLDEPLENFSEEALSALFFFMERTKRQARAWPPLGLRRNWMGGVVALGAAGDHQAAHFASAREAMRNTVVSDNRWQALFRFSSRGCGTAMPGGTNWPDPASPATARTARGPG